MQHSACLSLLLLRVGCSSLSRYSHFSYSKKFNAPGIEPPNSARLAIHSQAKPCFAWVRDPQAQIQNFPLKGHTSAQRVDEALLIVFTPIPCY